MKYRTLKVGERIEKGDQVRINGEWFLTGRWRSDRPFSHVGAIDTDGIRRPIKTDEDRKES